MRLLYGLCGEGMGHATRSKVVISHLQKRGHEVLVAASGKAHEFLSQCCEPGLSLPIVGLTMRCEDGAMDLGGTIEENAKKLPAILGANAKAWSIAEAFRPNAVVTDFDSFAWLFARSHNLQVVSIDNGQILTRCEHDRKIFGSHADGISAASAFTKIKAPTADHFIVTSFFRAPLKPSCATNTTLVPPILRDEVLRKAISYQQSAFSEDKIRSRAESCRLTADRSPVLVYKTASLDDRSVLEPLSCLPGPLFTVYGLRDQHVLPPNITPRVFDEKVFVTDLASCRAVIGSSGMSLLGEALALGKPVFTVPVRGQYEQVLNACYLRACEYGVFEETLSSGAVSRFLANLDTFRTRIQASPQHDGNRLLYATLDRLFGSCARERYEP